MLKITDNEVVLELENSKTENRIPKIIHRLLLYDAVTPDVYNGYIERFDIFNPEFKQVQWIESEVIALMNEKELITYNTYKLNIQKSDFARYIVLKYYGGIYSDYDILVIKPFISFYNENANNDLFFEEKTITEDFIEKTKSYKIRNNVPESALRISNYFIMSTPQSVNMEGIINLCGERCGLTVVDDYDVIYTSGPDVVSTYFNSIPNIKYLTKTESDTYFSHLGFGHWRN